MIVFRIKSFSKNTWPAKLKRTVTSVLPIDEKRKGKCRRCGACCRLPNPCPFMNTDEKGLSVCKTYSLRPLNCRKYPRTESELLTADTCGFHFDNSDV